MSAGVASLAFIPSKNHLPKMGGKKERLTLFPLVMVGAGFAFLIFLWYSNFHAKAMKANKTWATVEEYRRLPLAGGGAPR
jgi:hypothetical protein